MPQRYRSDDRPLSAFNDEVLVACPHCGECALVALHALETPAKAGMLRAYRQARFACTHCGRSAQRDGYTLWKNGAFDPVFRLPVWLHASCRHGSLWAYNLRHLDEIEAYVSAALRERRAHAEHGWSNRAWTSRLPRWAMLAKHRQDVLRCIARMRGD